MDEPLIVFVEQDKENSKKIGDTNAIFFKLLKDLHIHN